MSDYSIMEVSFRDVFAPNPKIIASPRYAAPPEWFNVLARKLYTDTPTAEDVNVASVAAVGSEDKIVVNPEAAAAAAVTLSYLNLDFPSIIRSSSAKKSSSLSSISLARASTLYSNDSSARFIYPEAVGLADILRRLTFFLEDSCWPE